MTAAAWLDPVSVPVNCAGQRHILRWAHGELVAVDHPDAQRERALVALGAESYRCLQLLDLWAQHADDLDVLVLATRGAADQVPVDPDTFDEPDAGGQPTWSVGVQSGAPTPGVNRGAGPRQFMSPSAHSQHARRRSGWFAYAPLAGHRAHHRSGVDALLTLDRRLADRLLAGVLATWTQRIADGDPRSDEALPALQAALYGRVVPAVRNWLGDPVRPIDLRLPAAGEAPSVAAGDTVALAVGVDWLSRVWLPGFAVTVGRLCLDAERVTNTSWSLLTVGPDLDDPRVMTVTW